MPVDQKLADVSVDRMRQPANLRSMCAASNSGPRSPRAGAASLGYFGGGKNGGVGLALAGPC